MEKMEKMTQYKLADKNRPIRLGIDLDGVIFDFELKAKIEFEKKGVIFDSVEDMCEKIKKDESLMTIYKEIYHTPGFYANLPTIAGAIEAFKKLDNLCDAKGHKLFKVYIVSTASHLNETCPLDKFKDIKLHFGIDVVDRIYLCRDKTLVGMDILVDDMLNVVGENGSSEFLTRRIIEKSPRKKKIDPKKRNEMSFIHIRFRSPFYIYSTDEYYEIIDNWTDGSYLDKIISAAYDFDLLESVD